VFVCVCVCLCVCVCHVGCEYVGITAANAGEMRTWIRARDDCMDRGMFVFMCLLLCIVHVV